MPRSIRSARLLMAYGLAQGQQSFATHPLANIDWLHLLNGRGALQAVPPRLALVSGAPPQGVPA